MACQFHVLNFLPVHPLLAYPTSFVLVQTFLDLFSDPSSSFSTLRMNFRTQESEHDASCLQPPMAPAVLRVKFRLLDLTHHIRPMLSARACYSSPLPQLPQHILCQSCTEWLLPGHALPFLSPTLCTLWNELDLASANLLSFLLPPPPIGKTLRQAPNLFQPPSR